MAPVKFCFAEVYANQICLLVANKIVGIQFKYRTEDIMTELLILFKFASLQSTFLIC